MTEIGHAKRIRVAGSSLSLAEQGFARAWGRLVAGHDLATVALSEVAAAVARARLAGIDGQVLQVAGLTGDQAHAVLLRGFDAGAGAVPEGLRSRLRAALPVDHPQVQPPALVGRLNTQPRAGATAPGRARVLVEPPESHGDHCFTVAVYGVLLAPVFDCEPTAPFLLGLAHHLHNVTLPDAGFAGEVLLGSVFDTVVATLQERELAALPTPLAMQLAALLPVLSEARDAHAQAFHAADVLDRVLQVHHHAHAAAFTASQALDDLDLVHAGPVHAFHLDVLTGAGL